jgi:hypothetical protein
LLSLTGLQKKDAAAVTMFDTDRPSQPIDGMEEPVQSAVAYQHHKCYRPALAKLEHFYDTAFRSAAPWQHKEKK